MMGQTFFCPSAMTGQASRGLDPQAVYGSINGSIMGLCGSKLGHESSHSRKGADGSNIGTYAYKVTDKSVEVTILDRSAASAAFAACDPL